MPAAVTAANAASTIAKRGAGVTGYFRRADGTLKVGNTAKAAVGAGAAGLISWALFDPKAGSKIGEKAGNVGSVFGNLIGGGANGFLTNLVHPQYIFGSGILCCSSCAAILVFFLMQRV